MNLSVIDLGFLYTKGIVNGKRIITKSVVGDGKALEFRDLEIVTDEVKRTKDFIRTRNDGQNYFVSDLAIDQSDTIDHSLKSDRFNSSAISVLVNTIFGIGLGNGTHSTYVVSGLPASQYAQFKDNIKALFMGEGNRVHSFSVNYERFMTHNNDKNEMIIFDRTQSCIGTVRTIGGAFLPQPHGAGMSRLLSKDGSIGDKELAPKTIAIIDPGFGTSDIYVINALSPVQRLSFSTSTAMNTAYTLISNKIAEKFDVHLPLYAIEAVVLSKRFIKNGVEADMTQVINWAFKATAQQLVSEIYNKWKNTHEIDLILVAGGGGAALYQYLTPEFPNIELIANPQWAIAEGYEKWGRRTWKDISHG